MPLGTAVLGADLKATLQSLVPRDLRKYIKIDVREF